MPGPVPRETRTVTTDTNGEAKANVVSGDELSKAFNSAGQMLFNRPVTIKAVCNGAVSQVQLDVLATQISWQYKNQDGQYVPWNGELFGLYPRTPRRKDIPLRAVMKFGNLAVIGHPVSWAIDTIRDKAGATVLPGHPTYPTYGRMSGPISTTDRDGGATATFFLGFNYGQIVFAIDDAAIYIPASAPQSTLSTAQDGPVPMATMPPGRTKARNLRSTPTHDEYRWVKGNAAWLVGGIPSSATPFAYPAPAGEEDNELLSKTLALVKQSLNPISPHATNGDRRGDPGIPNGWWFSQVVGNDPESAGYHFADLKIPGTDPKTGKPKDRRYTAAFDIVLTDVPIFDRRGRRARFGPYVKAMRTQGIVAWHRWAGEDNNKDGRLASTSNEMHCIDPATPYIKSGLQSQTVKFKRRESGGSDYDPEPTNPANPFAITAQQLNAVRFREGDKKAEFKRVYSNAVALGDAS